jgi:hypothetical protein
MSKQFLAVGDYLINPELLAYAVLEPGAAEPHLRLGFATRSNDPEGELHLTGDAAREVLRWLRLNAVFLSTNGGFGSIGAAPRLSTEVEAGNIGRAGKPAFGDTWSRLDISPPENAGRFLSRAADVG